MKKWTKGKAIEEYRAIRKRHGDRSKSSHWMIKNGHASLIVYLGGLKIGWNDFKNLSGFSDNPLLIKRTKESAIKEYQNIRKNMETRRRVVGG